MKRIFFLLFLFVNTVAFAQSVAINTDGSSAHASSLLDIKSSTKGLLPPRMSKAEKNAISAPAAGLLVFQTGPDSAGFHYYNGAAWLWLEALENKVWKTTGNADTDSTIHFIGTTDNHPLLFRVNNERAGTIDQHYKNIFFGSGAGAKNPINTAGGPSFAAGNVVIGDSAGANFASALNGSITGNTFIGFNAGKTIGGVNSLNTFLGSNAGNGASIVSGSVIIGGSAGTNSGVNNLTSLTLLGVNSQAGVSGLSNATALGRNAQIDTSNAMVLGGITGFNSGTNTNVAIGTTKPKAALHVSRGNAGFTGTIPSNRTLLIEDDFNAYIQMLTPDIRESGIFAGNASGIIKSGIVFTADSGVNIRTGGNTNRIVVDETGKVGVNSNFPQSKLDVGGSVGFGFRIVTASATLDENDHTIIISNTAAGAVTISLPLVTTVVRREYVIVNQTSSTQNTNFAYRDFTNNVVTVIPSNSSITLQASDGSFWYRIR
jgi:hypothetical protein